MRIGYDILPWITSLEFTVAKKNVQSSDMGKTIASGFWKIENLRAYPGQISKKKKKEKKRKSDRNLCHD